MSVAYSKGAKRYHASNPALASVMLVNPDARGATRRLDLLGRARRLGIVTKAEETRVRRGREKTPARRRKNVRAGRSSAKRPLIDSAAFSGGTMAGTTARNKKRKSRRRRRNAAPVTANRRRTARRRRRNTTPVANRRTRRASRRRRRNTTSVANRRLKQGRYGVMGHTRRAPKRRAAKSAPKRRATRRFVAGPKSRARSGQPGRHIMSKNRRRRRRNQMVPYFTNPAIAAYRRRWPDVHKNPSRRRRGGGRRRNPTAALAAVMRQTPAFLRRGVALTAGFSASFLAAGALDRATSSRLGRWNGLAAGAATTALSFLLPDSMLRKIPVVGPLASANMADIRMGMFGYGLLQILRMVVPEEWRTRFGLGSTWDVMRATSVRPMSEYVLTPGTGEYEAGDAGSSGGAEAAEALSMLSRDPMTTAEGMFEDDERQNALRGLGGLSEFDDLSIREAVGEYVRMGEYINDPALSEYVQTGGEVSEAMGQMPLRQAFGEYREIFAGLGMPPDQAKAAAAEACKMQAAGAAPQQAVRNLIDFPPIPGKAVTKRLPAGGAPVTEQYSDPLETGGIFGGGPYAVSAMC